MAKFILMLALFLTTQNLFSQVNQGGIPFRSSKGLKSARVNVIKIHKPNVDSLLNLVPETEKKRNIAAIAQRVDADVREVGEAWMEKGGQVFELTLLTPDASGIIVQFSEFFLPIGAKVFIYNDKAVLGAFTSENNKQHKSLTVQEIPGNSATIQLFIPDGKTEETRLKVGTIGYGFQKSSVIPTEYGGQWFGASLPCNNDINSEKGVFVQKEKRAVVKVVHLEYQFFVGYSAVLINNFKQDGTPYFLTARHCFEKFFSKNEFHPEYARSAVAYFGYESPTPGVNGDWSKTISGAEVLCWDPAPGQNYLDIVLIRFDEKPSEKLNPYYAGVNANYIDLDNPEQRYQNFTVIHHPKMDVKKVTRASRITCFSTSAQYSDMDLNIDIFKDDGVTEQGSSGSPLLDKNHLVIGNLSGGGSDECGKGAEIYQDSYAAVFAGYDFFPQIRDLIFGPSQRVVQGYDPFDQTQLMYYPNRVNVNWGEQKLYCKNVSSSNYEDFRWDFGSGAEPSIYSGIQPPEITLTALGSYTVTLTALNKTTGKDEVFQSKITSRYGPAYPSFYVTNLKGQKVSSIQYTDTVLVHNTSEGYAEKYVYSFLGRDVSEVYEKNDRSTIRLIFDKESFTSVQLANGKGIGISLSQVNPAGTKIYNGGIRLFPKTKAELELVWINSYGYNVPEGYYVLGKTASIVANDKSKGYNLNKEYYINDVLIEKWINQPNMNYEPEQPGLYELKQVVFNDFSRDSCIYQIYVHLTTDSKTIDQNQIKVFPTICKDNVNINGIDQAVTLSLFDSSGRLLRQERISENYLLNTSGLSPGHYYISLITVDKKQKNTFSIIKT